LFFVDLPIGPKNSKNPLKSTIEGFFNRTIGFKEGDVLEKMYYDLLLLRIEAIKNTKSQCTFGQLIGVEESSEPFRCEIDFSKLTVEEYYIDIDSHVSNTGFFNYVNNIQMEPNTMRIQRFHKDESFDLMLLYCDGKGKVHLVCLDLKSPLHEDKQLKIKYKQANYFLGLRENFTNKVSKMSKVGKAFAKRSVYVYWSPNDFERAIFGSEADYKVKSADGEGEKKFSSFPSGSKPYIKFSNSHVSRKYIRPVNDLFLYFRNLCRQRENKQCVNQCKK